LRAHEAFYVNGKLVLENITNEQGKLRGTVKYEEGEVAEGIHFIKMTSNESRNNLEVIRQYDNEGDLFISEKMGDKMLNLSRRISVVTQDSLKIIKSLILHNSNETIDSVQLTTRTYYDGKGNPILQIMHFESPKAPEGEEKEMTVATYYENFYGSDAETTKPNFPTHESMEGEWRSEKDNLVVFFAPSNEKHEFACFPMQGQRKLIPGLEEKDTPVTYEDGWKDGLIGMNNGTYEYDQNTGKLIVHLHNGKTEHLLAKMEWNTMILTPEKGNRNALRLVKSRN
jgi:hypothetical protein